jgi:hypothetical protein
VKIDLGDIELEANFWVKQFKPLHFIWHFEAPKERVIAIKRDDIESAKLISYILPEKVYGVMDLQADKKVSFSLAATDEVGNPVVIEPGTFTFEFSVDNAEVLALTDNGDGSGEVAAVSMGVATLSGKATRVSDGKEWTGAEAFNVVAGDAETFAFEFGDPEETTPDTATA